MRMASESAIQSIKWQRRFNARQSSRLRDMERNFAIMAEQAQNPQWWEKRRIELVKVDLLHDRENRQNWNAPGVQMAMPPKKRDMRWKANGFHRNHLKQRKLSTRLTKSAYSPRISKHIHQNPLKTAKEQDSKKLERLISAGPVLSRPHSQVNQVQQETKKWNDDMSKSSESRHASVAKQKHNRVDADSRAQLPPRVSELVLPSVKKSNMESSAASNENPHRKNGIRQRVQSAESIEEIKIEHSSNYSLNEDEYADKYVDDDFEDAIETNNAEIASDTGNGEDADEYSSDDDDFEDEIQSVMMQKKHSEMEDEAQVVISQLPDRSQQSLKGGQNTNNYSYSDDDFVQEDNGPYGYSDDEFERI